MNAPLLPGSSPSAPVDCAAPSGTPHPTWTSWLMDEVRQDYFTDLQQRLSEAAKQGPIYPPAAHRYTALSMDPAHAKVVILGQDPYHGPGQAHGLSFSVRPGVAVPPSLQNMYKEIEAEGLAPAAGRSGDLSPWHAQGVMLLNTVLSVAAGQAASHRGWGWERFTDRVIALLNERGDHLVFLLWGAQAKAKAAQIGPKHLVLTSPHPSPLSAHAGFFGNGHFRKANDWLVRHGKTPIVW